MNGLSGLLRVGIALWLVSGCGSTAHAPTASEGAVQGPSAPANERRYTVRISRPSRAGDRWHEHVRNRYWNERVAHRAGTALAEERRTDTVDCAMEMRVESVTEEGTARNLRVGVERCLLRDASGERPLLPAGSVLLVARERAGEGDGVIHFVDGSPVAPEIRAQLERVLSLRYGGDSDRDSFGSEEPRAVGDQWAVSRADVLERLDLAPDFDLSSGRLWGHSTLAGLRTVDATPCLRVEGELHAEGFSVGHPEVVGIETDGSELRFEFANSLPLDAQKRSLRQRVRLSVYAELRVPGADGETTSLRIRTGYDDRRRRRYHDDL